jgi:adenylosuccinate synthase
MRAKTAVVLGAQWGDEGKGKIVDVLSERFSAVARYAGGHNAGHTVIIGEHKFVLQLIPCGVLRPGCKGVIGNGVVLDPIAFLSEVGRIRELGVQVDGNLFVSNRAQVILPYHRMIELAAESAPGRKKIGTTSRGIGPAYEDKMARSGLRVVDLLHPRCSRRTLRRPARRRTPSPTRSSAPTRSTPKKCTTSTRRRPSRSAPSSPTPAAAQRHSGQGRQRDVRRRAGHHARHRPRHLSLCHLVVGHGRRRGHRNRRWTHRHRHRHLRHQGLRHARRRRPVPHRDSRRCIGDLLRARGNEYGAVTGRPRRCGWLDIPLLRYSNQVNGAEWLVVTKLDVLDELEEIPICIGYEIDGKVTDEIPADVHGLEAIKPRLHHAQGLASVHRGHHRVRQAAAGRAGVPRLPGTRERREDRHGLHRAPTATRPSCCRSLPRRSTHPSHQQASVPRPI